VKDVLKKIGADMINRMEEGDEGGKKKKHAQVGLPKLSCSITNNSSNTAINIFLAFPIRNRPLSSTG
jgi:hypothetical protein